MNGGLLKADLDKLIARILVQLLVHNALYGDYIRDDHREYLLFNYLKFIMHSLRTDMLRCVDGRCM